MIRKFRKYHKISQVNFKKQQHNNQRICRNQSSVIIKPGIQILESFHCFSIVNYLPFPHSDYSILYRHTLHQLLYTVQSTSPGNLPAWVKKLWPLLHDFYHQHPDLEWEKPEQEFFADLTKLYNDYGHTR